MKGAVPFQLSLPTENQSLFSDPSQFYMYTIRNFEGKTSYPWTAGQYGFVRNQKRTAEGMLMSRFHEGIDIRPIRRDGNKVPLDLVYSMASGKVVYTNGTSSHSSYGRYVVVEHSFEEASLYSLSAHLADIRVTSGQAVTTKTALGKLGYSGVGLDRTRAHVHVELNLLINRKFPEWHDRNYSSPNYHGIYNGLNLIGLDIARALKDSRKGPLSLASLLHSTPVEYRVVTPNRGTPDILRRYPALRKEKGSSHSWEIEFSPSGIPQSFRPSSQRESKPRVTWFRTKSAYHHYRTRGRMKSSGSGVILTDSGLRYLELLCQ
ncbi:MAG: M23 family metallopeptidase [Verrucomicrobiota bacterium]